MNSPLHNDIYHLIEKFQLLVRPSLVGGWIAGMFRGITGDGKSYCWPETEREAETIEKAVWAAAEATAAFLKHNAEQGRYFANINA